MADTTNQRFTCGFGKVNLSNQKASYAVMRLRPAFNRDSAVTTGKREAGSIMFHPVSAHPQINGTMQRDAVTHPNGTIIMLQSSWTTRGVATKDGAVLLRLRQEGALLNVVAKLPTGRDSILGDTFSVFQGYADILSPDEAKEFGVIIPRGIVDRFFDPEEVDDCFEILEVLPERVSKPTMALVATAQGVVMQEVISGPTRRMRFRRPPEQAEQPIKEFIEEVGEDVRAGRLEQAKARMAERKTRAVSRIADAINKEK